MFLKKIVRIDIQFEMNSYKEKEIGEIIS